MRELLSEKEPKVKIKKKKRKEDKRVRKDLFFFVNESKEEKRGDVYYV